MAVYQCGKAREAVLQIFAASLASARMDICDCNRLQLVPCDFWVFDAFPESEPEVLFTYVVPNGENRADLLCGL